ncbi:MAG: chromosome segregation protein [Devosia sp.]|nr:chromosome segregation protein [Devosia sp.]
MRLERLDILRYGGLTDRSFAFRPGAKLHLVYGPNEAGKSSVLAALGDLFFGFTERRAFDFFHDAGTLRIGANVRGSDLTALAFRRRRGRKNTLLQHDDSESALRDDALAPFLGSLNREMFERAFGLDSERLRRGAGEMLQASGASAGALFAAASGLSGLTALKTGLETEAGELFDSRASKSRLFYQIKDRHEEARIAERDGELKANDWKLLLGEIVDGEARLVELRARQAELRTETSRLERLRQLRPIIAEIDSELAGLAAFEDLTEVPAQLATELETAMAADAASVRAVVDAETRLAEAHAGLSELQVNDALVTAAGAVIALFGQTGDYTAKRRDLPRIESERDDYAARIDQLALRLGLASGEQLTARQPTDAQLAELAALVSAGQAQAARLVTLRTRLAEEQAILAGLSRDTRAETLIDVRPWRERLAALGPELRQLDRREELQRDWLARRRQLAERAGRLSPPIADLDAVALAPLPGVEQLAAQRQQLATADAARRALTERRQLVVEELEQLVATMAADAAGRPMPSRDVIAAARAERDTGFAALAEALAGSAPLPPRAAMENVERLIGAADGLADAALADAERVSRHAANQRKHSELSAQRAAIEAATATAAAAETAAQASYRALFAAEITPGSPDDMLVWRRALEPLFEERHAIAALGDAIAGLDASAEALRPALLDIARGVGSEPGPSLPVPALGRAVAERLDLLAEAWTASRAAAGKREDAERRIARLVNELTEAETAASAAHARFTSDATAIGLGAGISLEGAAAAIKAWEQLPPLQHERANRARRVEGMARDRDQFENEVAALVTALAPDLTNRSAVDALDELRQRAEAARAAATRRDEFGRDVRTQELAVTKARDAAETATGRLAALRQAVPDDIDLRALIGRLEQREALRISLGRCRQRFRDAAEGMDEDAVRDDLAGFDPDAAAARVLLLVEEAAQLSETSHAVFAVIADARRRREALEAGGGVELAAFQKHAAEAEIVAVARQWVVLKLASALLGASMERHRAANADPLVARAGKLLGMLTGGSLTQLVEDYDEDDHPRLKGVRSNGDRLGVEAMSEGTRDQLYLALRLAYLEDYSRNNEPTPFIGDDIFQTFDDDRTIAGMRALAEVSAHFQPILFTHHLSVVEAGRRALGDDLDLIAW